MDAQPSHGFKNYLEAWFVRGDSQQVGVDFLKRANVHGFALPPSNGWVAILAEGPPLVGFAALHHARRKRVIHLFANCGHRWTMHLTEGQRTLGEVNGSFDGADEANSSQCVQIIAEIVGVPRGNREPFYTFIGWPNQTQLVDEAILHRVAAWLGLPPVGWLCYETVIAKGRSCLPEQMIEVQSRLYDWPVVPSRWESDETIRRFPAFLFASHTDALRGTRRALSKMWKGEDRTAALNVMDFVVLDDTCELQLSDPLWPDARRENAWRLYAVSTALRDLRDRLKDDIPTRDRRLQQFVMQAMDHFWFSVSLLAGDRANPLFSRGVGESAQQAIFNKLLSWLPEILAIAKRLRSDNEWQRQWRVPYWSEHILDLAIDAGCPITRWDIETKFAGNWLAALMESNWVRFDGSTFRLCAMNDEMLSAEPHAIALTAASHQQQEGTARAEAYWHFVLYCKNPLDALSALREREFRAGRYYPAIDELYFPPETNLPSPGNQHASIAQALEAAGETGTRSILDLMMVSHDIEMGSVRLLPPDELEELYGTSRPTREMIEQDLSALDRCERGSGVCFPIYRDGKPDAWFFGGLWVD
jgi:hypothetical protein